jgi:hypothetical protein
MKYLKFRHGGCFYPRHYEKRLKRDIAIAITANKDCGIDETMDNLTTKNTISS